MPSFMPPLPSLNDSFSSVSSSALQLQASGSLPPSQGGASSVASGGPFRPAAAIPHAASFGAVAAHRGSAAAASCAPSTPGRSGAGAGVAPPGGGRRTVSDLGSAFHMPLPPALGGGGGGTGGGAAGGDAYVSSSGRHVSAAFVDTMHALPGALLASDAPHRRPCGDRDVPLCAAECAVAGLPPR